jgi:DNA-binding MarR family transcriptional regulator
MIEQLGMIEQRGKSIKKTPKTEISHQVTIEDRDFGLWKMLDHTRFMIFRLREKELFRFGLTPEQAHILDILSQNKGTTTINDIVDFTQRQHHSISTQISRMVKQGLVNKHKNASDKRKYEVSITNRGQTLLGKVTTLSINRAFACLSNKDKTELSGHLQCLLEKAYSLQGKQHRFHFRGE